MKVYNKKSLVFEAGYIQDADGNVVNPGEIIVAYVNDLTERICKSRAKAALHDQMQVQEEVERRGKEVVEKLTKTGHSIKLHAAATPTLDKKIEEAKMIERELTVKRIIDQVNEELAGLHEVIDFIVEDSFLGRDDNCFKFDTRVIESPLELTTDKLVDAIIQTHTAELNEIGVDVDNTMVMETDDPELRSGDISKEQAEELGVL